MQSRIALCRTVDKFWELGGIARAGVVTMSRDEVATQSQRFTSDSYASTGLSLLAIASADAAIAASNEFKHVGALRASTLICCQANVDCANLNRANYRPDC